MNAGGHGSDMAASVTSVRTFSLTGPREWSAEELHFAYRTSAIRVGELVTRVQLGLGYGDAAGAHGARGSRNENHVAGFDLYQVQPGPRGHARHA